MGVVGLAFALVVALIFAVRLAMFTIYWADTAHRDQPIAGWMTPGYVSHSWDVPPELIRAALPAAPAPRPGTHPTLSQIAEAEGVPLSDLIARLQVAIDAARAE